MMESKAGRVNEAFCEIGLDEIPATPFPTSSSPAVEVCNVTKRYGPTTVLHNFDMKVEPGTIYSLLGASGCGKTTAISCIVGLRKVDSGSIRVFGCEPNTRGSGIPGPSVGYMPQETALLGDFTVEECLKYFGRVLQMTEAKISERTEFLLQFLKLPSKSNFVKNLSGGQQRRVSLACALIHSPKLIILDEPTVGVDALLRQSIWKYLKEIVKSEGTTLIITTHHISEVVDADKLGLTRNGKLLVEGDPGTILESHPDCSSLDDVVLKLCLSDTVRDTLDNGGAETVQLALPIPSTSTSSSPPKSQQDQSHYNYDFKESLSTSSARVRALVVKNFISLRRQILFVFTLLFLPAVQLIICCYAIGRDPSDLSLGVVNDEIPNFSCLSEIYDEGCLDENTSCVFIRQLQDMSSINIIKFETEEEAREAVTSGQTWGFIHFGQNFTSALLDRRSFGSDVSKSTVDQSQIPFHLDMSSFLISATLQKALYKAFDRFTTKLLENCAKDPYYTQPILSMQTPIYGNSEGEFTEFVAPGTMLSLVFFMAISLTGVAYISEKKSGILERSLVCGVTPMEIILSHVIPQYVIMVIQTVIAFVILIFVFNITVYGSVIGVGFLAVLQGSLGMTLGFLLSTICDDEKTVLQMTQAVTMPLFVLSGIIWPIESMPRLLRYMSYAMPQTYASESIRSMVNRGWSLFHSKVWPGFVVTVGWIAILWLLTYYFSKRR